MQIFKDLISRCSFMTDNRIWFNGFTLGVKETLANPKRFDGNKCFDLVWRSRRTRAEYVDNIVNMINVETNRVGLKQIDRINRAYPVDMAQMNKNIDGDWYQGLWSGRLATLRFLEDPTDDDFPNLDT
jgi:hypothetical protein